MEQRPIFQDIKSYQEFSEYYWYREELKQICKNIGIDYSGTKLELNHNIEEYFRGNLIKKGKNTKKLKMLLIYFLWTQNWWNVILLLIRNFRDLFQTKQVIRT